MFELTKYLKQFRKQVILGPAFKMVEAIFELIVPLVMASMIDNGIRRGDTAYVWKMGLLLFLLGIVGLASSLVCQFFASRASQGFGTVVRSALFAHINTLSHRELDTLGTPSLITRLNNDINQLQLAVAMLIRLVFRAPFLAVGATVMAMSLDARMAVIFFAAAVLISFVLYLVMSRSIPFYGKIQRLLDQISLVTRENLEGVRVIRAFSRQAQEKKRFDETSELLKKTSIRVARLSALLNPVTFAIANGAIIAIVWYGGLRVNAGTLTQGQVIALWNYMTQVLLALIVVANLVVIFTKASASAKRVNEVFHTESSVKEVPEGQFLQPEAMVSADRVSFSNVSFSYEGGGKNCLNGITFSVKPKETIGIIGGTGSGKSTLVSLIPRFYDTVSGQVFVDGIDVKQYPFSVLRRKIGMVPQTAAAFSGTVRDNLLWGDETADDGVLLHALETAQAAEFVRQLPDGLDTQILQGGKNLSGGQKQRLTIARALVRQPEILILDDSASALDFATDAALRKALKQETARTGMTVFMVSQRVNTVKDADKILVLDDSGAAAGLGTHQELLKNCDVYREICLSQYSAEEANRT